MRSTTIYSDINLIGLDLAHARNEGPQMGLKRITGDARKDVDKAVVPQLCQQCLFVAEGVLCYNSWRGFGNFRLFQYLARNYSWSFGKRKEVSLQDRKVGLSMNVQVERTQQSFAEIENDSDRCKRGRLCSWEGRY